MRFTKSLLLAAISASVFALLASLPMLATKHPKYGGTLRLELQIAKVSLDPREWKTGSVAAAENARLAALIYDRLVTLDDYGRFQPALATEWFHDASSKNWQFKLRPNVKFSDGSALSAKDIVTALQPVLPPGLQISTTENGITIRGTHPVPDLLEQLASGRYFIFRVQSDGNLLGTGPFLLAESSPPTPAEANPSVLKPAHIKFRANEEAWAGRPFLDSIEVTLGDPALRQILNLQVGRADIIDIPPDLVRKARQDNLRVWSSPPATLLALRFDDAQSGASDPRLREALDLALDRDTMANVLLQRQALPAPALLPHWLSGYAFLFGTPMNLDRAKQIRATLPANVAAGSDPLRLRVDAVGDLMKLLGERVAVNARQANIAIQLVGHTVPSSMGAVPPSPSTGLHLIAWHYDSLSPRTELLNLAHYLHSEVSADALPDTGDPEKLYSEERRLLGERQLLPLLLLPDYVGIAPSVRNWTVSPSGEWRLADVWLDSGEPAASNTETIPSRNPAPGVHP
ncbi:MAG TPA: ABC transporter substrate-binding protein [Candidatus Acidoferrum sp.]|nr:ABC transporter substrate-binding protein [Candidatus Acidoferrum sp.]